MNCHYLGKDKEPLAAKEVLQKPLGRANIHGWCRRMMECIVYTVCIPMPQLQVVLVISLTWATLPFILIKWLSMSSQQVIKRVQTNIVNTSPSAQCLAELLHQSSLLTVDEDAFCDGLRCMYWLGKHEV